MDIAHGWATRARRSGMMSPFWRLPTSIIRRKLVASLNRHNGPGTDKPKEEQTFLDRWFRGFC